MMVVILLSIMSFTIASNPSEVWYTDVWINISTGEVIPDLNVPPGTNVPGASLADDGTVRRVSTRLDESRAPFRGLETFCIIIFTLEYFIRLAASPQGPGVIKYIITLSNLIDLISILPFYIELVLLLAGVDAGGLTVLSVLRLIRLTRITRIFKMSKNFEGLIMLLRSLKKSGPALMMLFAFMVRMHAESEQAVADGARERWWRGVRSAAVHETADAHPRRCSPTAKAANQPAPMQPPRCAQLPPPFSGWHRPPYSGSDVVHAAAHWACPVSSPPFLLSPASHLLASPHRLLSSPPLTASPHRLPSPPPLTASPLTASSH